MALPFTNWSNDHSGAFAGIIIAAVIFFLLATCFLNEFCYRTFGWDFCVGAGGSRRNRNNRQELQDEAMAVELQQEMERETREAALVKRRQERWDRYEPILKPYTMVVKASDFYFPTRNDDTSHTPNSKLRLKDDWDIEKGSIDAETSDSEASESIGEQSETASQNDTENAVLLTLPVTTVDGKPRRVDAECSICLMEYTEGDSVIWAARKSCPHAFHDECIMTWLSKGKKRCPCCRHFFVPNVKSSTNISSTMNTGADEDTSNRSAGSANEPSEAAIIEDLRATRHSRHSELSPQRSGRDLMRERRASNTASEGPSRASTEPEGASNTTAEPAPANDEDNC